MARIWQQDISLEHIRRTNENTAGAHLGIEFLEVGDDFLSARLPVDARTKQPAGILHGGISVFLAETLGSIGAHYTLPEGTHAVGLDINANHLRAVRSGWVYGKASPIHLGRSTQVWHIEMRTDEGQLSCVSRLTMAVLAPAAA